MRPQNLSPRSYFPAPTAPPAVNRPQCSHSQGGREQALLRSAEMEWQRTLVSMAFFVGTAGWTVPKQHLTLFSAPGSAKLSHLERYASRLRCVEINSSFHRPHRRATWERWAATTPDDFRFAVKAPRTITHTAKLVNTGGALLEFFDGVRGLGNKLGPVLVQLPPTLSFDEGVAHEFFTTLRELHSGTVVVEPRHPSWFAASADRLLRGFAIARVAADPPKGSALAARPGGWPGLSYWRLHGAPRTYYSDYAEPWLHTLAEQLELLEDGVENKEAWLIFDNTALGHATANAVWLDDALRRKATSRETSLP
jgi:uncharacterized protein YecE (DUF72 family)